MRSTVASMAEMYVQGRSLSEIGAVVGKNATTVRYHLRAAGVPLRSRADGVRNAAKTGKLALRRTRKGVPVSDEARRKQSESMKRNADAWAVGYRINSNGYVEFTRKDDPHCGRLAHCVAMEEMIGRRLKKGECVHHIDGNKLNNEIDNLALMTRSAHTRLHRFEERLAKGAK